jgi:hypothetical protein
VQKRSNLRAPDGFARAVFREIVLTLGRQAVYILQRRLGSHIVAQNSDNLRRLIALALGASARAASGKSTGELVGRVLVKFSKSRRA